MTERDDKHREDRPRIIAATIVGLLVACVALFAGWKGTSLRLSLSHGGQGLSDFLLSREAAPILLASILSGLAACAIFFIPRQTGKPPTIIECLATLVVGSVVGVAVSLFHVPWGH